MAHSFRRFCLINARVLLVLMTLGLFASLSQGQTIGDIPALPQAPIESKPATAPPPPGWNHTTSSSTWPTVPIPPASVQSPPNLIPQNSLIAPISSTSTSEKPKFDLTWNNGLFIQTPNKEFSAHIGGTIHYDAAWYTGGRGVQLFPGGVGRLNDGVNARRMRLYMEGSYYENLDYKFEIEFMNGFSPAGLTGPVSASTVSNSPGPTDAWVQLKKVPFLGNVRIGNQKEWFSLEHLEGYRSLMYMERSYLFDFSQLTAFNNGFSPGISAFRTWLDDRIFTGIGAYKNESDLLGFGLSDGAYAVTGRIAGLPIWKPNSQTYWHIGGAMSLRDPVNQQVQVRIRNSVRNAPFPLLNLIANTGPVNAESQNLFNLETAAAYGPLTLSAEWTTNILHDARVGAGPNLGDVAFQGFYCQSSLFLTGEHREWDPKIGAFKRVIPRQNFNIEKSTYGAIEAGLRYTYLDLDQAGILGGRLNNVTCGLTWYWNPNVRLQLNYDYLFRDGGTNLAAQGSIHSLGTRLAMDF